jgi:hypothetical protein
MVLDDRRKQNKLPTITSWNGAPLGYANRLPAGIVGATVHYTAGPTNATAESIANYQISAAAVPQTGNDTPFPGLAYTGIVEGDGTPVLAWDLGVRVWHSAALIGGVYRNASHVGFCYTGNDGPTDAQIAGLAELIRWAETQLGRNLAVEGHRDPPYPTDCPGPRWPNWKQQLVDTITQLRSGDGAATRWQRPGFADLKVRVGAAMGEPTGDPFPDAFGNVWQAGDSGKAVWITEFNRNFWLPKAGDPVAL